MTRGDHPSGTDRVAEVAAGLDADVIVNVQGDEPEIEPASIDRLLAIMAAEPDAPVGTLACRFDADADPADANAVKVVVNNRGFALYFSRSLIPYPRDDRDTPRHADAWLLHLGIYAYRRAFLMDLAEWGPTPLEQTERLEQRRMLENGYSIAVGVVGHSAVGIDTPEDYAAFVSRYRLA